ncbi:hypothetical protein TWF718_007680 [Orbilia javanica]|uniref:Uncharacterized protein n=1 Tax=Orbilia javanica TaxID=47235 RepID=A0AAN8RJ89_9PEZI
MNSKYNYSFPNHKLGVPNNNPEFKGGSFKIINNKKIRTTTSRTLTFKITPYVQLQVSVRSLQGDSTVASLSIKSRFPSKLGVNLQSDSNYNSVKMGLTKKFAKEIENIGSAGLKDVISSAKKYSHTKRRLLTKRANRFLYNIANSFHCPDSGNSNDDAPCDTPLGEDFANAFTDEYGDREDDPSSASVTKRSEDHHWQNSFMEQVGQSIKDFQDNGGNLTDAEYWRHFGLVAEKNKNLRKRAVYHWESPAPYGPFHARKLRKVCDMGGNTFTWRPGDYKAWPHQRRGMTVYDREPGCDAAPFLQEYPLTDTKPERKGNNLHMATEHILELQNFNSFWIWVTNSSSGQPFATQNNGNPRSRQGACELLEEMFYQLNHAGEYRPIGLLALGVFPNNIAWHANNLGEFVVLESPTNKVKMSLMGGGTVRRNTYMAGATVKEQLTVLKSCFLVFSYLRTPAIKASFENQVRRMGAGLNFLEYDYIPRTTLVNYQGYNLEKSWYTYVKDKIVPDLNRLGEEFLRDNLARLMPIYGRERPGETQQDRQNRLALNMLDTAFRYTWLPFNPSIPNP